MCDISNWGNFENARNASIISDKYISEGKATKTHISLCIVT